MDTSNESEYQVGQHLFTKDGRAIGNAIILEEQTHPDHPDGRHWLVETDFGNTALFSESELQTHFHAKRIRDTEPQVSEVGTWRLDRAVCVGITREAFPRERTYGRIDPNAFISSPEFAD